MDRIKKAVVVFILILVVPFVLSLSVAKVVAILHDFELFTNDPANVMMRVAAILVDLCLQSAYFAGLIFFTRRVTLAFVLLAYQLFMTVMFLRFGAPSLYSSLYALLINLGIAR